MTKRSKRRAKSAAKQVQDALSSGSAHLCAVQVKRIDRFYDFQHFQRHGDLMSRYAVIDGVPQIVYGKWGELRRTLNEAEGGAYRAEYGWTHFSTKGGTKHGAGTPFEVTPGDEEVLQVEVDLPKSRTPASFGRTFRREDSKDVSQSDRDAWLYVFETWLNPKSGDPIDGRTRLIRELRISNQVTSEVSQNDLLAAEQAWIKGGAKSGPDTKPRKPSRGNAKPLLLSLPVDWLGPEGSGPTRHYLYLSPFQLPWEAVEVLKENLLSGATEVGDPFFTDVIEKQGGKSEPLLPRPIAGPEMSASAGSGPRGLRAGVTYVVHIIDPVAEANARADELEAAVKALLDALPERAQEEKWRFAKRLELFTVKSADLRAIVEEELNKYLYPRGLDTIRLLVEVARLRAHDLVVWVGSLERPSVPFWAVVRNKADQWSALIGDPRPLPYLDAALPEPPRKRRVYYEDQFGNGPPPRPIPPALPQYAYGRNLYCDLMARYSLHVSDDTLRGKIMNEANFVLRNLPDTPTSQAWLNHVVEEVMKKSEEELDRRLRWDQEEKLRVTRKKFDQRKPDEPYGAIDFVLAKHSLYAKSFTKVPALLNSVYAFGLAKLFHDAQRYGDLPQTPGTLATTLVFGRLKMTLTAMDGARSLVELLSNLRDMIDGSNDPLTYLKATGNLASYLDSVFKLDDAARGGKLTPDAFLSKVTRKPNAPYKLSRLSIYANVVTVICCLDALFDKPAHDGGETTGRAIELAGAALGLAAALISSEEILAIGIVSAIGAILQWIGKELTFELSDSAQFLHECAFGKPSPRPLRDLIRFPQKVAKLKYMPILDSAYDELLAGKMINKYKEMSRDKAQWTIARQNAELMKLMYEYRVRLVRGVKTDFEMLRKGTHQIEHLKRRTRLVLVVTPWYWNCYCEGWTLRIQGTIATKVGGRPHVVDAVYRISDLRAQADRIKSGQGREPCVESIPLGKPAYIDKEICCLILELKGEDYDGFKNCAERLTLDLKITFSIATALDGKRVDTEVLVKKTLPFLVEADWFKDPENGAEGLLRRGDASSYL